MENGITEIGLMQHNIFPRIREKSHIHLPTLENRMEFLQFFKSNHVF